ncbi:MAG TPA: hypothetical protein VMU17_01700, partial [Elusimicrobiota bacterium]|nr:hypothetical protein [Elusimicrobiota bacterium]
MEPRYSLTDDTFVIQNYNQAKPFSSFLPGIAGPFGKPMWVFYCNRGQCVSSFGICNKNGAMLEFYPANKAYAQTARLGFRTFARIGAGSARQVEFHEPFRPDPSNGDSQSLLIRAHEIEIEELSPKWGLRWRVRFYNAPHEEFPVLVRELSVENVGRRTVQLEILDGLPQVVPFGLPEWLLKQMSRTMEAFAEVRHAGNGLPLFKLKIEPSDKPEVEWIESGFFAFAQQGRTSLPMAVDAESVFGADTGFQVPRNWMAKGGAPPTRRTESTTACALSVSSVRLAPKAVHVVESFYGQADTWERAREFQKRVQKTDGYASIKRQESGMLLADLTAALALHSGAKTLSAYSRQAFLDNVLRGGRPVIFSDGEHQQMFHYYSRKHGDMERDYNFFELSPTYYSQGNGNFRDVNQNRRSELFVWPGVEAGNVETFFNLLQLDGFNPLVIQFERFFIDSARWAEVEGEFPPAERERWRKILTKPFSPGELAEKLRQSEGNSSNAEARLHALLPKATKIQDASHGEGYWIDHWTYNLDLVDNFSAIYPERLKTLFVDRRDFTYFDSDHVVQPRHRKYVLRHDGKVRQMKAVLRDPEKMELFKQRKDDPHKVRTKGGVGSIYRTSLLAKVLGLLAVKAASLDPFGIGIEMEADKPGWCDALNGLPGLLGSSVNEAFELRRWAHFLQQHLRDWLGAGGT